MLNRYKKIFFECFHIKISHFYSCIDLCGINYIYIYLVMNSLVLYLSDSQYSISKVLKIYLIFNVIVHCWGCSERLLSLLINLSIILIIQSLKCQVNSENRLL